MALPLLTVAEFLGTNYNDNLRHCSIVCSLSAVVFAAVVNSGQVHVRFVFFVGMRKSAYAPDVKHVCMCMYVGYQHVQYKIHPYLRLVYIEYRHILVC
ncbi:unnamed protein product [Cercopithifilaria johnstoni]|uniref:Uncharacterized protein n=1 Tax=Cercopithifilaria johnstoni TaxID=2874296 RepID=A0A8J2LW47_9BILA|nr:unnamed protein product [Cercopithifilaria johnstoni]